MSAAAAQQPPRLSGETFRITVAQEDGFINIDGVDEGANAFSGYCVDILNAISRPDRANFTYELLTSSGRGELCVPRLGEASDDATYSETYYSQFNCGQGDVNDLPRSATSTDMYLSSYYVTPSRQLANQFTIPYSPPTSGTLAMYGTATGVRSFDDLIAKQEAGEQGPVCVAVANAYVDFLKDIYPTIQVKEIDDGDGGPLYDAFNDGTCDIFVQDYPIATKFVLTRSENDECMANGKPIGVIGDPLSFGFHHWSNHIPPETVNTLSYWMTVLMTCAPGSEECPDGNFFSFYTDDVGTGEECGYVSDPSSGSSLSGGAIAGIVIGCVAFVAFVGVVWHMIQAKKQRARYRKRLVQQVARNITIGPSPSQLDADAIANELKHIGKNSDGTISKEALKSWMEDDKLGFLSDADFEALWSALSRGKDVVDPIEFCAVLATCGPEFASTYDEQQRMSKDQRRIWASQRLSLSVVAKSSPEAEA